MGLSRGAFEVAVGTFGATAMKEREFIRLNEQVRRRQAAIRRSREKSEPVRIGQVLPAVMRSICKRTENQGAAL